MERPTPPPPPPVEIAINTTEQQKKHRKKIAITEIANYLCSPEIFTRPHESTAEMTIFCPLYGGASGNALTAIVKSRGHLTEGLFYFLNSLQQ